MLTSLPVPYVMTFALAYQFYVYLSWVDIHLAKTDGSFAALEFPLRVRGLGLAGVQCLVIQLLPEWHLPEVSSSGALGSAITITRIARATTTAW